MLKRANGGHTRSAHFMMGVLAGAVAVGAYAVACNGTSPASGTGTGTGGAGTGAGPGTTVAPSASDVAYANAQSGLAATTVQGAIDEIATTVDSALWSGVVVTGGAPRSTTWAMEIKSLDVGAGTLNSTGTQTLTLTETAPGQGSYETSGANIFILDGLTGPPTGTRTGKYFVVGNLVLLTGELGPAHQTGATWLAQLTDGGRSLTLSNFGSLLVVLTRQ